MDDRLPALGNVSKPCHPVPMEAVGGFTCTVYRDREFQRLFGPKRCETFTTVLDLRDPRSLDNALVRAARRQIPTLPTKVRLLPRTPSFHLAGPRDFGLPVAIRIGAGSTPAGEATTSSPPTGRPGAALRSQTMRFDFSGGDRGESGPSLSVAS